MMKIIVFAGPTISQPEAKRILDATYLPPVKQGDVLSWVYSEKPDVIAIIDGLIFSEMPVWHKEILYALDNQVAVYGASAMGALRAGELNTFGMKGIGQVYRQIEAQELEDDDEVLCSFRQEGEGYRRLSEPMVNLRATFAHALEQHVIPSETYTALIAIAKGLYYPNRTFPAIFEQAVKTGIPETTITPLQQFVADQYVDIQKRDAVELLQTLAQLTPSDFVPEKKSLGTYSTLFYTLYDRDRVTRDNDLEFPMYYVSNYVGLNHPDAEDINFQALNRKLTLILAEIFGITARPEEIDKEVKRFRKKHELVDEQAFQAWLAQNDLNAGDFRQLMEELARIRKTQQWYIMIQGYRENTRELLEELKLKNEYTAWKAKTAHREHLLKDQDDELRTIYNRDGIQKLFKEFRQFQKFPWNVSVLEAITETGINLDSFTLELIKEKVARQRVTSLVDGIFAE
jgi:hypothetical protein